MQPCPWATGIARFFRGRLERQEHFEDAEHLSALSVGHFVMAGLTGLGALPLVAYAFVARSVAEQLGNNARLMRDDISGEVALDGLGGLESLTDGLGSVLVGFLVVAFLLTILTAIGFFLVGLKLRQRRWWTFCYLSGWGECLLFPFGTILGVFTIVVLSRPSVKNAFGMR